MNRVSRALFTPALVALVALSARVAVGCATTDEVLGKDFADASDGSITVTPPTSEVDSGAPDAPLEAEVSPQKCTESGWCYTTLPAEDSYDASAMLPIIVGPKFALRSVWVAPDNRAWAVTNAGHVLQWDGTSWRVAALLSASLQTVWGSSATDIWVAGEQGVIFRGTVSGTDITFQRVSIGTNLTIGKIVGRSADDVWAIADGQSGQTNLNRVYHFTAATAGQTPAFVTMTVPSSFTHTSARLRVQALWLTDDGLWVAGYETTSRGPIANGFQNQIVAIKWNGPGDAGPAWDHVPLLQSYSDPVASGIASRDGVQLVVVRGPGNEARVVRVATDEALLDANGLPPDPLFPDAGITQQGDYAWTNELAHQFGAPKAIWATGRNDVWLVGLSGVIRHYDGTAWNLVPLSLSSVTPLLRDLYDIQPGPVVGTERDLWVVGDDVALRRKVKVLP
jgi:hypothetical protein